MMLFFFSFVILYLLTAWICSNIATNPKKEFTDKHKPIYVASNGVHTAIIIPVENIDTKLKLNPNTKYVAFGWGDKGFFLNTPTWGDLTFSTAVNAVFLKSPTAMHVTEYKKTASDWKKIMINDYQLISIEKNILDTFQLKEDKGFIKIEGYTYGTNDTFYEANGNYTCLNTCNTWTNDILKKAEIKTAIWTPFDSGILKHL